MGKIRFIIGILTEQTWFGGVPHTFYWRLESKHEPQIGDFAIVDNKNTFAMVEIVGIGETTEDKERELMCGKGIIRKAVKYIVPRQMLEDK